MFFVPVTFLMLCDGLGVSRGHTMSYTLSCHILHIYCIIFACISHLPGFTSHRVTIKAFTLHSEQEHDILHDSHDSYTTYMTLHAQSCSAARCFAQNFLLSHCTACHSPHLPPHSQHHCTTLLQ